MKAEEVSTHISHSLLEISLSRRSLFKNSIAGLRDKQECVVVCYIFFFLQDYYSHWLCGIFLRLPLWWSDLYFWLSDILVWFWFCRFILKMEGLTSQAHTEFPKVRFPYLFVPGGDIQVEATYNLMFPQRPPVRSPPPHTLCRYILASDFAQPHLELRLAEQV